MIDSTLPETFAISPANQAETERAEIAPIKKVSWPERPKESAEETARVRLREFLRSSEVPPDIKALGVLTEEMLIRSIRDLEFTGFKTALYEQGPYYGKPTIYGIALYEDRLDLALSSMAGYGSENVQVTSLPINELNAVTGDVSLELAQARPEAITTLISANASQEKCASAKLSVLRHLAKARPGNVVQFNELGGIMPAVGLAYTTDREKMIVRLGFNQIPDADPLIGETVELYRQIELYHQTVRALFTAEDYQLTTPRKIEGRLKRMSEQARRLLGVKAGQERDKSYSLYSFTQKLGFSGNQADQKWNKIQRLSFALLGFENELRIRIIRTITEGKMLEEIALSPGDIDALFIKTFRDRGDHKIPDDFSVTQAVTEKTPLENLPL